MPAQQWHPWLPMHTALTLHSICAITLARPHACNQPRNTTHMHGYYPASGMQSGICAPCSHKHSLYLQHYSHTHSNHICRPPLCVRTCCCPPPSPHLPTTTFSPLTHNHLTNEERRRHLRSCVITDSANLRRSRRQASGCSGGWVRGQHAIRWPFVRQKGACGAVGVADGRWRGTPQGMRSALCAVHCHGNLQRAAPWLWQQRRRHLCDLCRLCQQFSIQTG